ncbi:NifB/NifX family molybdenum-iron cluster-binding protein [Anaerocolumna sp. MB42-C2]|uniref:NifB/NifX family molybdenum-iron cluster-binding protein n=1 Tax=Anaerocolumna sp. MB42-C2 TaxID=3070997 RepID=UPI0027E09DB2|nr:NifB/NifX family molybdenum-iron cluster-binding protein [Anaerocolumna sp. MB42-C2]WMJ87969.1 NifB/NifX family molybdenum-iron cluster-binding protein [Anaerocolumna sp. MB42-C2]
MKIAVSAIGKEKESLLDRRFGRCEYFLIFDMETGNIKAIGNDGLSSGGGAGIAAASQIIEENISAVITGNLGPNAFELMEKAGIKAYSCDIVPAFKAVDLLQKNKLSEINTAVGAHNGMR